MDDRLLRQRAREAVQTGELPDRYPDTLLGGNAHGATCAVCGDCVRDGMELELVFTDDVPGARKVYWMHPRCLAAFEREVLRLRPGGGASLAMRSADAD